MNQKKNILHPYVVITAFVWIVIVFVSYVKNISDIDDYIFSLALGEAKVNFQKDVIYRRWVTMEGGVYVPISEYTQPNPYLSVSNRDVETKDGKKLTLVNPAYMTRMVYELADDDLGARGHITSLNPIRPENKADVWETNALKLFEQGLTEYYSIDTLNGQNMLRFMAPFVTERACLKCHESQGYKEGDIRGGISISVPYDKYQVIASSHKNNEILFHIILGFVGLSVIFLYNKYSKELENKRVLNESLINEKELNNFKNRFITTASHEFRTPLTIIQTYTELLLKQISEPNNEKYNEYTSKILRSVHTMTGMIDELLFVSKIDEKKIMFNPEPTDLRKFCEDFVEESIVFRGEEHSIKLSYLCNQNIFNVDSKQILTILQNLISNADKYTPAQNQVELIVDCDHEYLYMHVKDNGMGIPEIDIPHIFDRFHRGSNSGSIQGTGLGLSIVKSLVEMHKGKILVKSEVDKGTIFTLKLPTN